MNEDQIIDMGQQQGELHLNSQAREGLKVAASWSMGLAILGFIGVGFMVLAGIAMLGASSFIGDSLTGAFPFPFWILSLFYLVIAALYFFPLLYLYQFSSRMKRALLYNEQQALTESCVNLGKHYKFLGIMMIALMVLYFIMIIAMMAFGMTAAKGLQ